MPYGNSALITGDDFCAKNIAYRGANELSTILPIWESRCYCNSMEALEQLEYAVRGMIDRLNGLKGENERLSEEIALLSREKNLLETENMTLNKSLEEQKALRLEALDRIDGLLRKLQNYEKVNQVIL